MKIKVFGFGAALLVAVLLGCTSMDEKAMDDEMGMGDEMAMSDEMAATEFTVTVEVIAGSATPIAPLAWAVHSGANPFVTGDMGARLKGLEALAEDGDPSGAAAAVSMVEGVLSYGVVAIPEGKMDAGPAFPGGQYRFTVSGHSGDRLSFATMYVQSNDLFYSTGDQGLPLFEMDAPVSGDVTGQIVLYDAGTEVNEEPGMGMYQAPRQSGPNTGPDEMGMVMKAMESDMMYTYPATQSVLRVTVEPHDGMM